VDRFAPDLLHQVPEAVHLDPEVFEAESVVVAVLKLSLQK